MRVRGPFFKGATDARDVESTRLSDLVLGSIPIATPKVLLLQLILAPTTLLEGFQNGREWMEF
jgi:hypothetical protein